MRTSNNRQRSQRPSIHDHRVAQASALAVVTIQSLPERQQEASKGTQMEALRDAHTQLEFGFMRAMRPQLSAAAQAREFVTLRRAFGGEPSDNSMVMRSS